MFLWDKQIYTVSKTQGLVMHYRVIYDILIKLPKSQVYAVTFRILCNIAPDLTLHFYNRYIRNLVKKYQCLSFQCLQDLLCNLHKCGIAHKSVCTNVTVLRHQTFLGKCENRKFPLWWFFETSEFYVFASAQNLGVLRNSETIHS